MSLPPAAPQRQLMHRRSIDVAVYAREDGLWEVDARLADVKSHDVPLGGGVRRAGEPVHDMTLRLVIDEQFRILQAGARTEWMPYPGQCDAYGDVYARLVGLNLMQNFRRDVKSRLGGTAACTHITELTQVLPTAVLQAFAGTVIKPEAGDPDGERPFQLDRCHALRADGEVARLFYPHWYRPAPPGDEDATVSRNPL
ncbi:DUF2889 domain-containing protein [Caldimonas tepidiphila]|uniref:DUF2889 domain-containing protein n=1 Tax=Caldimonas tepidiphila TaxID=2315841 RepID=UPI000E5B8BCA|nr:DUF2889 domain-containing protein [Caldimonas tepidiphila]